MHHRNCANSYINKNNSIFTLKYVLWCVCVSFSNVCRWKGFSQILDAGKRILHFKTDDEDYDAQQIIVDFL